MPSLETARENISLATAELAGASIYVPEEVALHFHFSPHDVREDLGDFNDFKRLVETHRVFLSEGSNWTEQVSESLNKIAQGNLEVYNRMRTVYHDDTFHLGVMEAIYFSRSKTTIANIDLGEANPLYKAYHALSKQPYDLPASLDFDTRIDRWGRIKEDEVLAHRYRELVMLTNFGPKAEALKPQLSPDRTLRMLFPVGRLHTNLFTKLQEVAPDPELVTQTTHGELPGADTQLMHRKLLGIEVGPLDERLAHAQTLLAIEFTSVGVSLGLWASDEIGREHVEKACWEVAARFSFDDIAKLYEQGTAKLHDKLKPLLKSINT